MVGGEKPRQQKHSSTATPKRLSIGGKVTARFSWKGSVFFFLAKSGLGTRLTK